METQQRAKLTCPQVLHFLVVFAGKARRSCLKPAGRRRGTHTGGQRTSLLIAKRFLAQVCLCTGSPETNVGRLLVQVSWAGGNSTAAHARAGEKQGLCPAGSQSAQPLSPSPPVAVATSGLGCMNHSGDIRTHRPRKAQWGLKPGQPPSHRGTWARPQSF